MKAILIDTISEKINLSKEEIKILHSSFQTVTKNKNEYLVYEGNKSSYLYFLTKGYVRFFYNEDGNEITTQIYAEKSFITSFESFIKNNPSKENIQCNSDCTLLRISKNQYENLYKEISDWSMFCESVYQDYIMKTAERVNSLQNLSASNRYLNLLQNKPNIALNTPIKHLASYLGIKPQSLSRIRKETIK